MDGIHDLGGMQGFGRVPRGPSDEACFHAAWQRRVFGLVGAGAVVNGDAFRHAIERLDPVTYLTAGYWGRWLGALETLAREDDPQLRRAGSPQAARQLERAPAFAAGETVRVRRRYASGHTRLPGYVRGRRGTVVGLHGAWVYPDTHAHGHGEDPQHLYTVRFEATELWGETAEPASCVHVDLFEPYLAKVLA